MSEHRPDPARARSFDAVAEIYDRARPSYPREAVQWLLGTPSARVLELGAGTGKLTEVLGSLGHRVTATDPSEQMLRLLADRVPQARAARAEAERIPLAARSVDAVVCAQAFHWFDAEAVLPEVARVLRAGGVLGLAWNIRDERIPWVRRLGTLLGEHGGDPDPTAAIDGCGLFGPVAASRFRFWQPLTRDSLRDLVRSRSAIAVLSDIERDRVLRKVDELYDGYGRGADGMLLPYVTHAFRATVRRAGAEPGPAVVGSDEIDTDALLIDFR